MSDKQISKEIISEIAEELASANKENNSLDSKEGLWSSPEDYAQNFEGSKTNTYPINKKAEPSENLVKAKHSFASFQSTTTSNSNFSNLSFDDLRKKKGIQNLEERNKLLSILKWLFGLQLVFMNLIVAIIVLWIVFKCDKFNDIDKGILELVISFVKSYIIAVLAELLGGIIYITHKVFSEKFNETLPK